MKVLFIGGTGRLSKDVASRALETGCEVYLFTRGTEERKNFIKEGYHMLYGDIRDYKAARTALKDYKFDTVIDFLSLNVDHIKHTLDILDGMYQQYIFISSAAVYSQQSEDEVFSEDASLVGNKRWSYGWNKTQCELYLKEYFRKKKEWYTVIRPAVTFDKTRVPYPIVPTVARYEWTFIDRVLRERFIPVFDEGKTLATLTSGYDFAKGAVGLFMNEKAHGEAYHICSDHAVPIGSVLDMIEDVLGIRMKRIYLTQKEISKACPQYREILEGSKGHNRVFDNSKIKKAVPDFQPEISLKEGVKEMIHFYQNHPEMQLIDWYWNGQMDRLCGDKKQLGQEIGLRSRIQYLSGYTSFYERMKPVLRRIKKAIKMG